MRNLGQYRQYVYAYLDLDIEDVAGELIDQWVKDGFGRIIRSIRRWPFYELEATPTTQAGGAPEVVSWAISSRSGRCPIRSTN